ncbi:tripartite motif-containing protein 2-like [Mizuhopecten yessoensis]|uniref:tripartite motif-containing protein 2-like n=1 Tax=Mizuhopecten yessoensis TaxID=6573 RepID=UPI000B45D181|nr:tripartite motif-containing protein 2-like [Mizuhopecten yessoensis]XP_021357556.1 tripartite motif-containing protein 2-like [Mizuhopecten yessoensis]XP_021357557.1 tripartite motif-containing protein 2-like [Mizuhopecten yessoensis]
MAEGGPRPELDLHLLECPICLERLRQPKSLPCLHCFCQDCLRTYITKELSGKMASGTSFPCPVCRGMATPVNQTETKENWQKQFQTDAVIQELIKLKVQSSKPLYCTPCQTKGNPSNPARFWCKKNESGFCETCKTDHHDIVHIGCDILDITRHGSNRPKQNSSVPHCNQHDENMVWYCEDHKLLGCSMCVFKDHRRCEAVTTATEYIQKLKAGSQLTDMQAALKKGAEVMHSLVKDFDEQLQVMVKNQEIALQSITDLRQRIDKRLDELQKNCTDKLITLFKDEKRKLDDSSRQCERLKKSMLNTLKSIKATEENDNTETIVLYQRGQAEVESCMVLVTEMNESFTSVNVKHQTKPELVTIGDDAMGDIVVEKLPRRFPESHGYLTSPMSGRRVREVQQFDMKTTSDGSNCFAVGVVYLPYNQIVISDRNNKKLKLFTDEGQCLDELTIQGTPWDICFVDDETVAVAVSSSDGIHVVTVENSKMSCSSVICLPDGKGCLGITHINGRFVVCTNKKEAEVFSVTQDGTTELLHQYSGKCYFLSHDPINEDILVSCSTNTKGEAVLSRLSADKRNTTVIQEGIVSTAAGVTVDRDGNIYLCGYGSNNVVQMSGDGTHVRELLVSSDGINHPFAIAVCGDMFAVTAYSKNYVRLLQLY